MATAAALLEWQPLMHLQHENYQLREENHHLHWQVKELLNWKARTVRHMVALAPKRSKAQREIKHAAQLQKQLHAVEKTLQERVALEETAHLLEQKEQMLAQRIDKLENEKQALSRKCEQAKLREEKLADGLQFVSDMFRVHLEKLVAMRETIDTTAATDSSSAREPIGTMSTGGGGASASASPDHTNESFGSTTLMITGLTAVSEKCLHWFHEHVEQTFTQQQQKSELYETQHAELEQLRSRVESVQQTHLESASKDQHYRVQVTQLQHVNAQLENELSKFQTRCVEHSHTQNQLGDQMRLLVTEIRQYLRLVRGEIKKKFGYVLEAIAHAENWSRILDALERHVRLANVAITSPSRARRETMMNGMRLTKPIRTLLHANANSAASAAAAANAPRRLLTRSFAATSNAALAEEQAYPVGVARVQELAGESAVAVTWQDGFSATFHKLWLRDHCTCPECLHPETKQRQIDTASIPLDPACHKLEVNDDGTVSIAWNDSVKGTTCRASSFDPQWLRDHAYSSDLGPYPHNHHQQTLETRALWDRSLQIPKHDFAATMEDLRPAMTDLYKYGLVVISNTPSSMDETERFSRKIGFVLRTIYGEMWTTNPQTEDQEYNDTASTNLELLHHTDGTYMRDPPGLQIFNCIAQAGEGGESRYIDAFNVVEKLRQKHPEAYKFLSTTPVNYHHFDNDAHLATMEPIIKVDHAGNVVQFRHNDYDRAPLTHLPFELVEKFYRYHRELMKIMRDESMEATLKLRVGEMIVVDNQRVMHGRHAFNGGERSLIGSYIGRNEYDSRLRVLGII